MRFYGPFTLLLIFLLSCLKVTGQTVSLKYDNEPLNDILIDLHETYDIQVSVNAEISGACFITINKKMPTIEEALDLLARKCGFNVANINNVYTFRTNKPSPTVVAAAEAKEPEQYLYQGLVLETNSEEPLPYSYIRVAGKGYIADEYGRFSFKSVNLSESIELQSLGYDLRDTLVNHGGELRLSLEPRIVQLKEINIYDRVPSVFNTGSYPGHMKFTDLDNSFVPGFTNNVIFNNLRLYPGIMAAGESIADFVIWGSYAGQNHVIYDGISMFNSWGVNDDIGRINPFMIKNLEVYKGGYGVEHGDRIGGVVEIDGRSGDLSRVTGGISITNQLASGYINIPLFNHTSSIQLAGRQSYFQAMDLSANNDKEQQFIVPEYSYSDLNLKFTSNLSKNDRLEISAVGSSDNYKGRIKGIPRVQPPEDVSIDSRQFGSSLKYSRSWKNGGLSNMTFSYSEYEPDLTSNFLKRENDMPPNGNSPNDSLRSFTWSNPITEFNGFIKHQFAAKGKNRLTTSLGYIRNDTKVESNIDDDDIIRNADPLSRLSFYLNDQINFSDIFLLELGLKADLPDQNTQLYLQPRVSMRYNFSRRWNIHGSWGLYNQFISRNTVIDELGNRTDIWQVSDGDIAPVLNSMHSVLGVSYLANTFEVSVEGFYKTSDGFTRLKLNRESDSFRDIGESRSYGLDVFTRKKFSVHEIWLSYSLARVEERYSNGSFTTPYRLAPQSQLHELKGAAVLNFHPFEFSLTSVYGSGFPNAFSDRGQAAFVPYWRTDLAFQYVHRFGQTQMEVGFSILNLFNQENVRLNQSVNIPDGQVINTLGIPRTPIIFVNFHF